MNASGEATIQAKLFIERIDNSIINQHDFNGGVAQLVRARDS